MRTDSIYTHSFYEEETRVAVTSAQVVLPVIFEMLHPDTVIDIGSGTGGWASVACDLGAVIRAVDNEAPEDLACVPLARHDLEAGYDCAGWDLAICLEVAEHLSKEAGPRLVAGLAGAKAVLFSAATPGQPGIGHINCQPHEYWHELFAQHGMTPTHIGPIFSEPVADFYRRNLHLYRRSGE